MVQSNMLKGALPNYRRTWRLAMLPSALPRPLPLLLPSRR